MKSLPRAKAPATATVPVRTKDPRIACRDDLPFTSRNAAGEFVPWQPERGASSPVFAANRGHMYVDDLACLARTDEYDAYVAGREAMLCVDWNGAGDEEHGFADGVMAAAVIGWRAMRAESPLPFHTDFDPTRAQWRAMSKKVEAMEAQLRAMNMRPWRSLDDGGMG